MDSKCAAFWKHTNIRSDNRVFPCCRFKQPLQRFDGDLNIVLFSKEYDDIRARSERGDYISECSKCYYEESNGKKSLRQQFNEEYDTDSVGIEYLEIGFDNICNLTCDGCWSEWSSSWSIKLHPSLPKTAHYKSINEVVNIPESIKKISFLGGEPLMTSRHYTFLSMIENPENIEVVYTTNGTFLLKDEVIKLLKKFKKISFILSIDAYGNLNDKVRSGSNWQDIIKFIEQLNSLDFEFSVNSVLHMNTWQGIADLENFVSELGVDWTVNVLTYPTHLDIATTTEPTKIINEIKKTNISNKDYIINHIRSGLLVDHKLYPYLEQCKNTIQILTEELKTFDYDKFLKTGIKKYDDSFKIPYYTLMQSAKSLKDIIPNGYYSCDNSVAGIDMVEEIDKPNDIANWLYLTLYEKDSTVDVDKINHFQKTIVDLKTLPGIKHLSVHWMENEFMTPYHNDTYQGNIVSLLYTISLENPDRYVLYINEEPFNFSPNSFFSFRPDVHHRVENNTGNTWIGVMMRIDRAYFKNV